MKRLFSLASLILLAWGCPTVTQAKLGEDLGQLKKRFGHTVQPIKPGRRLDEAYQFTLKDFSVVVGLVNGHAATEWYFSQKPLVNGHTPESTVMSIATTSTGQGVWRKVANTEHGYRMETLDKQYVLDAEVGGSDAHKDIPATFAVFVAQTEAL